MLVRAKTGLGGAMQCAAAGMLPLLLSAAAGCRLWPMVLSVRAHLFISDSQAACAGSGASRAWLSAAWAGERRAPSALAGAAVLMMSCCCDDQRRVSVDASWWCLSTGCAVAHAQRAAASDACEFAAAGVALARILGTELQVRANAPFLPFWVRACTTFLSVENFSSQSVVCVTPHTV